MGEMIRLRSTFDGFEFGAYRAAPAGERKGGVILLQEVFGLDANMRGDADRWAGLGYEAVAPSMFDRRKRDFTGAPGTPSRELGMQYMRETPIDQALGDIVACRDYLAARGKVFFVGYCWGGSLGWIAAAKLSGLAAVSAYYGSMIKANAALKPQCPTIIHLGSEDPGIPAGELVAALKETNPEIPVHVYQGAGHGFSSDMPGRLHGPSAELARRRTLELFQSV